MPERSGRIEQAVNQRERLLALGSLSAGLTHELNNPAAAAVRATATLRERVGKMRHKLAVIAQGSYSPEVMANLIDIQERTAERVAKAPAAGLDVDWLDQVAAAVAEEILPSAIGWLSYTVETELLMDEIHDSTTRVSHLVDASKQYSQLDRAPFQNADVHELLDSTLLMLSGKIGPRIEVVKEYDRTLPKIPAYPAELNQVWTNPGAAAAHIGRGGLRMTGDNGIDPSVPPSGSGCVECEAAGGWWFHLRRCARCGHVGCCDSSPAKHATAHFRETGHPFVQSFEPGESWYWGFETNDLYESGPELAPPVSHPAEQPAPGPVGRVPADWARTLRT